MDSSPQQFPGLLVRSRLFSPSEADAVYERWLLETKGTSADLGQFLKWMVAKQYLTEYQATMLGRGHSDGFFLHQYKILERIGRGRMAGVYKAVHNLGQVVAVKVLPPSRARKPILLARFQREARLALRLRHPNVVRSYHFGDSDGLNYLVMEYLEGETLEEVVQRRSKLPVTEAVRLVYQALLGLQHLHEQGLVHRDLKPANLMLVPVGPGPQPDTTSNVIVKILDIGLGRVLYDEAAPEQADDPRLTATGVLLGTPDYMAPEQAKDARSVDIRSDVYSLGCVLYHALTGQTPFPDINMVSQMIRHATEPMRPVREFSPEVPEGLQQVLGWMMAKEPGQRYPTPERAAQALQVFLVSGVVAAGSEDVPPQMRSYLKWLDSGESAEPATAPFLGQEGARQAPGVSAPVAAVTEQPAPKPPQAIPIGKPAVPIGKPLRPAAPPQQAPRQAPVKPVPAATRAGAPVEKEPVDDSAGYDVELVPITIRVGTGGEDEDTYRLSRRDFLMLGIGAGGVLAAVFIGWILARLLRKRDRESPELPSRTEPNGADKEN